MTHRDTYFSLPDDYVRTASGLRTRVQVLEELEYEREVEQDRYDRHAPANWMCW